MSELSLALSNPGTGAAIAAFAKTALVATVAAVAAPEVASVLLVGGAYLAVGAAYYAWKNSQTKAIQDKALAKHLQGKYQSGLYDVKIRGRGVYGEFFESTIPKYGGYIASGVNADQYLKHFNSSASAPAHMKNEPVMKLVSDGKVLPHPNDANWFSGIIEPITIVEQTPTVWEKLTDADRKAAIDLLTDDDWKDVVGTMTADGTLQPGQTLPNDVMTLGNAQVQPSGSRVLSAEQQAIREAIKPELDQLNSDMAKNAAAIASIAGAIGFIGTTSGNIDRNVANLGNVATQTRQSVDNVGTKVDSAIKQSNDNFNKVKKRLSGIASFLNFDRILNVLIWVNTLHNAFMLSADLARSLLSMVSTSLKALPGNSLLGLPTEAEDGSPLDLATTINKSVEGWVKGAIGAKNYKLMVLELAQINRIYQSTANISSDVTSAFDAFRQPLALGVERISIVANALRRNGVVRDNSYSPMSEKITIRSRGLSRIDRVTQGLEALSNATSAVESVASNVISIQEEVTEIKKYRKEYEDEKTKLTKEIEKKEVDSKKVSQAPEISEEDEQRYESKKL